MSAAAVAVTEGLDERALTLVIAVERLSRARSLEVQSVVSRAARRLTGADGATFVLRLDDQCFYADEDAIGPLWKGQRFPLSACVSGWAMQHRRSAIIPDIYADARVPVDAYRPTFVKSLVMVPVRSSDPVGAIGNYWAEHHEPTAAELQVLEALADCAAIAVEHVRVLTQLEDRIAERTAQLHERTERAERLTAEVERLATRDPLTAALNRRGFLGALADRRAEAAGVLVFADVDGLKGINDRLGHEAGDDVIAAAAGVLASCVGDGGIVGRWGGDEFVAYAHGIDDADFAALVRDRAAMVVTDAGAPVRLSLGFVHDDDTTRPLDELIAAADTEMYDGRRTRLRARVPPTTA
jgi:diguanylate cyclase (GGDEF)-like protein